MRATSPLLYRGPRPGEAHRHFPQHSGTEVRARLNYFDIEPQVLDLRHYAPPVAGNVGSTASSTRPLVRSLSAEAAAPLRGLWSLAARCLVLPHHVWPWRRWDNWTRVAVACADRDGNYALRDRLTDAHLRTVPETSWMARHRGRIGFREGTRAVASGLLLLALDHPRALDALQAAAAALESSISGFRADVARFVARETVRNGTAPRPADALIDGSSHQGIFIWDCFMLSHELLADAACSRLAAPEDGLSAAERSWLRGVVSASLALAEEVARYRLDVVTAYVQRGCYWALFGSATELAARDAAAPPFAPLAVPDDSRHAEEGHALLRRCRGDLPRIVAKRGRWDAAAA